MNSGPCIAVLDDDASIRKALKRLLRSEGYEVELFRSGDEFLRSLPHATPDCLVLDLYMPEMNGLDVQSRLAGSQIPIVFITAHDDPSLRARAFAAGAVAFLAKPVAADLLLQSIEKALRRRPFDCFPCRAKVTTS